MTETLQQLVLGIMKRIPVVTRPQLSAYMKIRAACKDNAISDTLTQCAHDGSILIACNDMITTRESYDMVRTAELPYKFGVVRRLRGNLTITAEAYDFLDCFWIILHLLPDSLDFILTSYTPFRMLFLDRQNNRFVQIARIRRDWELACLSFLQALPSPLPEDRVHLRRIALLDDAKAADLLTGFGFTDYCLLDDKVPGNIVVLKKVDVDEAWEESRVNV